MPIDSKIIQLFPQKEPTILERFQALEDKSGSLKDKVVVNFIAKENAKSLIINIEKNIDEYVEFYIYFLQYYGDKKSLCDGINKHWPVGPRIFRLAEEVLILESDDIVYNFELTHEQEHFRDVLVEYIFSKDADREVSISYSCAAPQFLFFPRDIPEIDEAKNYLALRIGLMMGPDERAVMVFRYSSDINEKDILNGFIGFEGFLDVIPLDELKAAHETDENGNYDPDPTAIFVNPDIDFS